MNHLAHLYLARASEEWMVGGFIADAVKGKHYTDYDKGISEGILLHRFIDMFTDEHAIVRESKTKLRGQFGLFSGVIVDIFYDHFLAKNWNRYSDEPLEQFTIRCYSIFEKNFDLMPEQNQRMLPYMKKENWLLNYGNINGIRRSMEGMAKRITAPSHLELAPDALLKHYDEFEKEFAEFFSSLNDAVKKRISEGLNSPS